MVAMNLLVVVLVISVMAGSIGFLVGYFAGRRAAAKGRQAGFPMTVSGDAIVQSDADLPKSE